MCLFALLPFAYLFVESEGLFGYKRGLLSRAKETLLTLFLLSFVIMGLVYIITALVDWDQDSFARLISKFSTPYFGSPTVKNNQFSSQICTLTCPCFTRGCHFLAC